jgi:hypothetical protein
LVSANSFRVLLLRRPRHRTAIFSPLLLERAGGTEFRLGRRRLVAGIAELALQRVDDGSAPSRFVPEDPDRLCLTVHDSEQLFVGMVGQP